MFSNYDGYKIYLRPSPDTLSYTLFNVINRSISTTNTDDLLVASLVNSRYYTISVLLSVVAGYDDVGSILYKVVNTTNNTILHSKSIPVGINTTLKVLIPNDGL